MSVLQDMTKGIMETKATKAAKLTPVAGESSTTVEQAAMSVAEKFLPFPFDSLSQTLTGVSLQLRREAAALIEVADKLDAIQNVGAETVIPGTEPAPAPPAPVTTFQQDFDSKVEAAKAQTFADLDDGAEAPPAADDWSCPKHGRESIKRARSRGGREYDMCVARNCDEFEKE